MRWNLKGQTYTFNKTERPDDKCIPIKQVTQNMLEYAKELEMIV